MSRYYYSQRFTEDRFSNYRQIQARFDSTGKCGHPIKKGDTIGYHRTHGCQCSDCWRKWSAENAEAEIMEIEAGQY